MVDHIRYTTPWDTIHPLLEGALLRLDDMAFYDPRTGLRLEDDAYRAPEDNIIA